MKVIIVSPSPAPIRHIVQEHGHPIVAELPHGQNLLPSIAALAPHLVVIDRDALRDEADVEGVLPFAECVRTIVVSPKRDANWTGQLVPVLLTTPLPLPVPSTVPQRVFLIDERFKPMQELARSAVSTSPSMEEDSVEIQEKRLGWMLRMARLHGDRAEAYRQTVCQWEGLEFQEMVAHLLDEGPEAMAFARDQWVRYAGYLCHFLPGIELDHLPATGDLHAGIRFLHFGPSLDAAYVVTAIMGQGMQGPLWERAKDALGWIYDDPSVEKHVDLGLMMISLMFTFRNICSAQSQTMAWCLDPKNVDEVEGELHPVIQRNEKIVGAFWQLREIFSDRPRLKRVLADFHAEVDPPELEEGEAPPTYAEMIQIIRTAREKEEQP